MRYNENVSHDLVQYDEISRGAVTKSVYCVICSVANDRWCGMILRSVCVCVSVCVSVSAYACACVRMCVCMCACVCVLTSKISFPIQHDVFGL